MNRTALRADRPHPSALRGWTEAVKFTLDETEAVCGPREGAEVVRRSLPAWPDPAVHALALVVQGVAR